MGTPLTESTPRATERARRVATVALGFHEVTDDPTDSGFQRRAAQPYKHTTAAFARHIDLALSGRCTPALVTDVDLTRPGEYLLLTFDDGGKSALYVSDYLAERGLRGHFFIVSSLVGATRFLTAAEVRDIRSCGHLIGTHSHTHPDIFPNLSAQQMVEEWQVSRARLSDLLGESVDTASIPGGDLSPLVIDTAASVGLRHLFTSEPWAAPRKVGDCWVLGRFILKNTTDPRRVGELAHLRGWTAALLRRRMKVIARWAVPSLYRRYVAALTREP